MRYKAHGALPERFSLTLVNHKAALWWSNTYCVCFPTILVCVCEDTKMAPVKRHAYDVSECIVLYFTCFQSYCEYTNI